MTLSVEQVKHLANLARLAITSDEAKIYASQLGDILAYVDKLQKLAVNLELVDSNQLSFLRTDVVKQWADTRELINCSPASNDNYIEVPEVLADKE